MQGPSKPGSAHLAERRSNTRHSRVLRALPALLLAMGALFVLPVAGAAPVAPAAPHGMGTAATESWAWGAFGNSTFQTAYIGAYADTLNLTGGNISAASAFVAEAGMLHAEYGAFAVLNVTATSPTARALEAQAISVANLTGYLAVSGTLPAPGVYAAGAAVALANETSIYAAHMEEVSAYVVFANYTVSNTTLALANEKVETWTGVNITLVAVNWPQYVTNPNGSTTVSYTTAAYAELAWVADVVSVDFAPALPIAEFPLSVGESWNATTNATVVGWAAYANVTAASVNGVNATSSHSGAVSLNVTAPVSVAFTVTGSKSVVFPNGTEVTGYTVQPSVNGGNAGTYVLWDGLVLVPVTSGTTPSAPQPTASPVNRVEATAAGSEVSAATVNPATGLPVAVDTQTGTGTTVATAPMAPASAHQQIATTETPAKPTGSVGIPSTHPTPPTGQVPTTPPTTANSNSRGGVDPALLAAIVAGIVVVFLAVALVRERRRH